MGKMLHLDLFSGIGGFAYAADQVFGDVEHIFCDNDKYCKQVLKKHWPESEIHDDIRNITNSNSKRQLQPQGSRQKKWGRSGYQVDLLTGGFPCQPFSAAGLRRGTADDRHLWPEMLRVIRLTKPTWIIAENVRGLLTWSEGLVFEQVCVDLEAEGYEVQPLIIPAVGLNAPHRRDRIWFVAHSINDRPWGKKQGSNAKANKVQKKHRPKDGSAREFERAAGNGEADQYATNTEGIGTQRRVFQQDTDTKPVQDYDWNANWIEVAAELCGVDDGLPAELDGFKLSKAGHRKERLKSLGNAIVPQVAMKIMESIRASSVKEDLDNEQ
jgi:DNA (cytosine-5)-methyltransferase 1